MTINIELRNFIDHYGWEETLDALEEISLEREEPIIIKSHKT